MTSLVNKLRDIRFLRYIIASVGALAVDVAGFLSLIALGMAATPASSIGYSLGIVTHWLLSSRTVFQDSVAERGSGVRTQQKAMFVISALIGLGLTTAIVAFGVWLGGDPRLAKLVAIVASFLATWLMRSRIVFKPRTSG